MPELPDVEGFRHVLASCGQGRRIERVEVADPGVLRGVSESRLREELEGRAFGEPDRHGKWLIARTDGGPAVLLHFGMTGELVCCPRDEPPHRYDRVRFDLADGRGLRYRDQRKLQGLRLAGSEAAVDRTLAGQGPDALDVDRDTFRELLAAHRGRLKSVLIDQSVIAGLGNLLVDEILWRARLRPTFPANRLSNDASGRLHAAMRRVLTASIPTGRVPDRRSWLTGHRDDADPTCPRCGNPLHRDTIGGRTTVWCPHCQDA